MSSLASKLLMCVCAGGTGAAIAPVSKAVRSQNAPRHAVVRRAPPAPMAVAAVPCTPVLADVGLAPGLASLGGISPMLAFDDAPLSTASLGSSLPALGSTGEILSPNGGGFGGGGGGGGGAGGGGTGGGGTGGGGLPPVSSNAPEPTSWVLMIGGFGLLGGAMRYARRSAAA